MDKNILDEAAMLFRKLSPANQKCFLMMVRAADVAEKNARETYRNEADSILENQEN